MRRRLVALGAEHVEAAELAHLVALGLALGLEPRQQLLVAGFVLGRADRRGPRCMHSRRARPSGLPPRRMSTPRPAMLVATVTAAELAGLGDDLGFPLVLLGVQHLVRDAPLLEQARELLRLLDRDRADEHRLALLVALGDVVDRGVVLRVLGLVDEVGVVERGPSAGSSGSTRPAGRRCARTRRPRWTRCRSCRASFSYMRK